MRLPKSYYNIISFIGTVIAGISLFLIIVFSLVVLFYENTSSYVGLFIYIIIPGFFVLGLIIIPIGMMIEVKRRKTRELEYIKQGWPIINLNVTKYRNAVMIFGFGTVVIMVLSAIGSYEAFHYT